MAHGRFKEVNWVVWILNLAFFLAWVYGTHHFFGWDIGITGVLLLASSLYFHMAYE